MNSHVTSKKCVSATLVTVERIFAVDGDGIILPIPVIETEMGHGICLAGQ